MDGTEVNKGPSGPIDKRLVLELVGVGIVLGVGAWLYFGGAFRGTQINEGRLSGQNLEFTCTQDQADRLDAILATDNLTDQELKEMLPQGCSARSDGVPVVFSGMSLEFSCDTNITGSLSDDQTSKLDTIVAMDSLTQEEVRGLLPKGCTARSDGVPVVFSGMSLEFSCDTLTSSFAQARADRLDAILAMDSLTPRELEDMLPQGCRVDAYYQ